VQKLTAQEVTKRKPFVVTASHNAVLQAVYKYQLLTCLQLVKALGYSPSSLERVQRLVKQLTDNEYLLSLARPVIRGKAPLVYTLARKGLNYLKSAGIDVRIYFRPAKEQEQSYLFLQHTLSLNDVLIAASNLHKYAAEYSLLSFTHERVLKTTPYKVKIWLSEKEESVTLIPDAFMQFAQHKENGKDEKYPFW
jgi:hypothetical protein